MKHYQMCEVLAKFHLKLTSEELSPKNNKITAQTVHKTLNIDFFLARTPQMLFLAEISQEARIFDKV